MLKVQYSTPSEVRVNDRLEKLEKYTHRLSDISDYLITAKYPKAADHVNEVEEFLNTLDRASTQIFKVIHDRHAAAPQAEVPAPPAPVHRTTKPSDRPGVYRHHSRLLSCSGTVYLHQSS